jgi:outer membrane protein
MNKKIVLLVLLLGSFISHSQELMKLSLGEVIDLAKNQSPATKAAKTNYNSRYWQYRLFKSNYLPQLSVNGTLPDYNQSINPITQDNGLNIFVKQSLLTSSMRAALSQNIGLTGGNIFVTSGISRIDLLYNPNPSVTPNRSFLANPVLIGISQPVLGFNQLKWDKRIEPLKYEEARKKLNEDLENVSSQATDLFFSLFLAQMSLKMQDENVKNADTLYKISKGRYNLGKIAENELLQMEMNLMTAQNNQAQAQMDRDFAMLRLANFLKLPSSTVIELKEPELIPSFKVDEAVALQQAEKNSQRAVAFKRNLLEANMNVQAAKRNNRFQANVNATYGLTNSGTLLSPLYENPQQQQTVNFTFSVPILTWGRNNAAIKTALANRELTETTVEQDRQNFAQEILLLAKQTNMYRIKLLIAMKSDTIAQKRFSITMSRYLIGKVSITDLNIANQDKISANANYISSLRNFWMNYFDLRKKTLYDFEKNQEINYHK